MTKKRLGKKERKTVFKNEKRKPDMMIDFLEDYIISSLLFSFPAVSFPCILVRSRFSRLEIFYGRFLFNLFIPDL